VQDAQHNLAIILNQEHQYAEAETLFSQLIATRIRVFGAENRATLFGRQALASNLNAQKRYREAAVEAKAALDGLMRLLGENNESVHQGDAASRCRGRADPAEQCREPREIERLRQQPDSVGIPRPE